MATTLLRLGDTYRDAGQPTQAATAWQAALDTFTDLNHPDADCARIRLAQRL